MQYETRFGSMADYDKGGVEIIDDDPKNYVFSNLFEVAATSREPTSRSDTLRKNRGYRSGPSIVGVNDLLFESRTS